MDSDSLVSYEQFKTDVTSLNERGLECFAKDGQWPDDALVQIQAIHDNNTITITDGFNTAEVHFPTLQHVSVSLGAVVELIGMTKRDSKFHVEELCTVLDPLTNIVPMVDTKDMSAVCVKTKMTDDLPAGFRHHMEAKNKRKDMDDTAPSSAAKSRDTEAIVAPPKRNPLTQYDHLNVNQITSGRDGFVIGRCPSSLFSSTIIFQLGS